MDVGATAGQLSMCGLSRVTSHDDSLDDDELLAWPGLVW